MPQLQAQQKARELSADLYRVSAVVIVVTGHWLLAAVTLRDGRFGYDEVLVALPWTQWLTWLFQVVPVFFVVGGYANAASWTHWYDIGGGAARDWLRHRVVGILGPTTAYVVAVLAVAAVIGAIVRPDTLLAMPMWVVALHLWFVPVYLAVVALTPIAVAAQRRWGLRVPFGLAAAVAIVDVISIHGPLTGIRPANYALCWAAIYQLGIAWYAGGFRRYRAAWLATAAAVVLAAVIPLGLYPVSMIGVPGQPIQNTSPPTVALLALAGLQVGILIAAAPAVTGLLRRARWRHLLTVANENSLALYLWHMFPVVAVALVGYPSGLLPQPDIGTARWWWWRLGWVAILAVAAAGELALLWRARSVFARNLPTLEVRMPRSWSVPLLAVGAAMSAFALWRFAGHGFAPGGRFPVASAVLFTAGVLMSALHPSGGLVRRGRDNSMGGDR